MSKNKDSFFCFTIFFLFLNSIHKCKPFQKIQTTDNSAATWSICTRRTIDIRAVQNKIEQNCSISVRPRRCRTLLLLGFCFSRLFCFRSVVVIDVFSGIACRFNNVCALKHWIFERIVSVFLCYFGSICSAVCLICKVLLFVCPGQMSILV